MGKRGELPAIIHSKVIQLAKQTAIIDEIGLGWRCTECGSRWESNPPDGASQRGEHHESSCIFYAQEFGSLDEHWTDAIIKGFDLDGDRIIEALEHARRMGEFSASCVIMPTLEHANKQLCDQLVMAKELLLHTSRPLLVEAIREFLEAHDEPCRDDTRIEREEKALYRLRTFAPPMSAVVKSTTCADCKIPIRDFNDPTFKEDWLCRTCHCIRTGRDLRKDHQTFYEMLRGLPRKQSPDPA